MATTERSQTTGLDAAYREHQRYVWAVCYRMTGSTADADELVQEAFVRAVERPPKDTTRPWRPWLVKVATNLARDRLRRRKSRRYVGPWLPAPVETEGPAESLDAPEARYGVMESVTFAFLLALEALTPQQRAVLILRDVLDYSVRETATALELSESNVKVTHHRARRALARYDTSRCRPDDALRTRTQLALQRFLTALAMDDAKGMEATLRDDARMLSDGGGEYFAARVAVLGPERIARFYRRVKRPGVAMSVRATEVNGLPALLVEFDEAHGKLAPRVVTRVDVDADGKIAALHSILASDKLAALHFS